MSKDSSTSVLEVIGSSDELSVVGFIQLPIPVLFDRDLSDAQKILYGILLRFSRSKSFCFPGVARLAKGTGSTERTVQRNMLALEKKGLVVRRKRPTKTNFYDLGTFREVYGHGRNCNILKDEVVDGLLKSGEDKLVEWVLKGRELLAGDMMMADGEDLEEVVDDGVEEVEEGDVYADDIEPLSTPSGLPLAEEIPVSSVRSGERRFETVKEAIDDKQERSQKARDRKQERRRSLANGRPKKKKKKGIDEESIEEMFDKKEFTFKDLEEEWRLTMRDAFPSVPGISTPWAPKQYGIVKQLTLKFEKDGVPRQRVFEAFIEVVRRWEQLVDRYGVKGYPTVQLIASYALTWFPEIWSGQTGDGESKREKARRMRDFDATRASEAERKGGITFL
jgi:hypothetical protein